MRLTRGRVGFLLAVTGLYFAWQYLPSDLYQTAILHIPPGARNQDTYVTLWVVDDAGSVWVRAGSSKRIWLPYLANAPVVELERSGGTQSYHAMPEDTQASRIYVDALFRKKYGLADQIYTLFRSQMVPIRLVRP